MASIICYLCLFLVILNITSIDTDENLMDKVLSVHLQACLHCSELTKLVMLLVQMIV